MLRTLKCRRTYFFVFFKQKTAYEMRISDWSSDVCSSDLNYALFLSELCDLLGVSRPEPASADRDGNDYVFERAVTFRQPDGGTSHGRIDLYKRGCFVLEAKQSRQKGGADRKSTRLNSSH